MIYNLNFLKAIFILCYKKVNLTGYNFCINMPAIHLTFKKQHGFYMVGFI